MNKTQLKKKLTVAGIEFDPNATNAVLKNLLPREIEGNVSLGMPNPTAKLEIVEDTFAVDKYDAYYTSKGRERKLGPYATIKDANRALNKIGANTRRIVHITE